MRLGKKDYQLIDIATKVAKNNSDIYADISMHVGCAVRGVSGNIYVGVNLKSSHSVCAEQVAIGQAYACGERDLDTIVAVKMDKDGNTRVVSPCGLCRYMFDKFGMSLNVIVEDVANETILKVPAAKLLPYPYKRERKLNTNRSDI